MGGRKKSLGERDLTKLIKQPSGRAPDTVTFAEAESIVFGCLLGDSWVSFCNRLPHICFSHSQKQRDYVELKRRLLSTHFQMGQLTEFGESCRVLMSSREEAFTARVIAHAYSDGSRGWPNGITLTPLMLMFWYLDDGFLIVPRRLGGTGTNFTAGISLQALPDDVIEQSVIPAIHTLTGVLMVPNRAVTGKIKSIGVYNREGAKRFIESFRAYWEWVPPSMWYKVGADFSPVDRTSKPVPKPSRGSETTWSRLTESIVRQMRQEHFDAGVSVGVLARRAGVSDATARQAINGKTWAHV